jgi:DNA-binding transcriptional LysR family regulator
VNLTDLRCVVAVIEAGSFVGASRALDTVQSNVSERIRSLERELGGALFTRGRRGIVATAKGKLLYQHARRVLADFEKIEEIVKAA